MACRLRGIIDRLELDADGELVVTDYKTGQGPRRAPGAAAPGRRGLLLAAVRAAVRPAPGAGAAALPRRSGRHHLGAHRSLHPRRRAQAGRHLDGRRAGLRARGLPPQPGPAVRLVRRSRPTARRSAATSPAPTPTASTGSSSARPPAEPAARPWPRSRPGRVPCPPCPTPLERAKQAHRRLRRGGRPARRPAPRPPGARPRHVRRLRGRRLVAALAPDRRRPGPPARARPDDRGAPVRDPRRRVAAGERRRSRASSGATGRCGRRIGPAPTASARPRTSSFPSGHASAAFTAAGRARPGRPALARLLRRSPSWCPSSRVYVKMHHASDVVAGAALGHRPRPPSPAGSGPSPERRGMPAARRSVGTGMTDRRAFSVTWDYRCPFARNAHEHVLDGLRAGADWDVTFVPFSLGQVHVAEGEPDIWGRWQDDSGLLALQAGVVVRDKFADRFLDVHEALFALRHDDGGQLRDEAEVRRGARGAGRRCRRGASTRSPAATPIARRPGGPRGRRQAITSVWGVPTFIVGDQAAFVRLWTGRRATRTAPVASDRADPRPARRAGPSSTSSSTPRSRADLPRRRVVAMADRGDAQRTADDRRRGADVEPREGSAPQLVDRQRHAPRPGRPIPSGSAAGSSAPPCMVPRLRQRVVPALGRLAPPEWRDDPDFDLDYHLRWSALPAPGLDAPAARPRRHLRRHARSTAPGRCGSSSSSRASRTAGPR